MRFIEGNLLGRPSSTPGSCRICGVGRLRVGEGVPDETGYVNTEIWVDMEGVIILCQTCTSELGRLVPDPEKARLEVALSEALNAVDAANAVAVECRAIAASQRAELALLFPGLQAPAPEPSPELPFVPTPVVAPKNRKRV